MLYCPLPTIYALVQIDIQATVKDLDDDAKAAAKDVKPAFCIVYLHTVLELPMPPRPWFRYLVYLIGPGLRHAEPHNFITPEMCVPIYPATEHPTGRAPLQTLKPFPFTNCYHWADAEVNLRVARSDYSDESDVIKLPGIEHFKMEDFLTQDLQRIVDDQDASIVCEPAGSHHDDRRKSKDSLTAFPRVDVFDLYSSKGEDLLPVVNLWYDLERHVDQDNIPDPMEFLKQKDTLVRIVTESNARKDSRSLQYHAKCKEATCCDMETVNSTMALRAH